MKPKLVIKIPLTSENKYLKLSKDEEEARKLLSLSVKAYPRPCNTCLGEGYDLNSLDSNNRKQCGVCDGIGHNLVIAKFYIRRYGWVAAKAIKYLLGMSENQRLDQDSKLNSLILKKAAEKLVNEVCANCSKGYELIPDSDYHQINFNPGYVRSRCKAIDLIRWLKNKSP